MGERTPFFRLQGLVKSPFRCIRMTSRVSSSWLRCRRRGWRASLGLHVLVLGLLVAESLSGWPTFTPLDEPPSRQITLQVQALAPETIATVVLEHWPPPNALERADAEQINVEELLAGYVDPRWQEVVEPWGETPAAREIVNVELLRVIREAEQTSSEENLDKLAQLSRRLADHSSAQAVDDINARLTTVLGAAERAGAPTAEQLAGEFDFSTAQLFDVERVANDQGAFTYTATLVDSAGRKFESPMAAESGATAFRTLQIVKSNPLLDKVYRGVVMSLLDELLKAAQQ